MRYFIVGLVLLAFTTTFAQTNFQPGKIVDNNGDTLRGFIDLREWDRNPSAISFKQSLDAEPQEFTINAFPYFITAGLEYQRFTVSLSMDGVEMRKQLHNDQPAAESQTVWLKVLQTGKFVSLFSYRDAIKIRFFLLEAGDPAPKELIYRLYNIPETATSHEQVGFVSVYKNQLVVAAKKAGTFNDKLKWKIDKSTYSVTLAKIVSDINGVAYQSVKNSGTKATAHLHPYFGAGFSTATLTYLGTSEFAKTATSNPSTLPYFLIGVDYGRRTDVSRLRFSGELMYSSVKNVTTAHNDKGSHPQELEYTFNQNNISVSVLANYNIINQPKFKFYVAAGLRGTIIMYGKNQYILKDIYPTEVAVTKIDNFFHMATFMVNTPLRAGIIINRRIELSATYVPSAPLNYYTYLIEERIHFFQGGISYLLK